MVFYLFPELMYHRVQKASKEYQSLSVSNKTPQKKKDNISTNSSLLQSYYDLYIAQGRLYGGLGIFLTLFSGTDQNINYKKLVNKLRDLLLDYRKLIDDRPEHVSRKVKNHPDSSHYEFYSFRKRAYVYSLFSFLNFGLLFKLMDEITDGFKRFGNKYEDKLSSIDVIHALPIVKNLTIVADKKISYKKINLTTMFYLFLNPFRLLDNILNFLHLGLLGLTQIINLRPIKLVNAILSFLLGLIKIPVKISKYIVDLPLSIVDLFVLRPVMHFVTSIADSNVHEKIIAAQKKIESLANQDDQYRTHLTSQTIKPISSQKMSEEKKLTPSENPMVISSPFQTANNDSSKKESHYSKIQPRKINFG